MPTISQITLPSGNTYELKDAYARQLLAGGLQFVICWDGTTTPVVADIPAGVIVSYNDTSYTGTKAASTAESLHFYLVKDAENNLYSEYVAIRKGAGTELDPYTYSWEKLGDSSVDLTNLGALAYKDSVTLSKGSGDNVLGESTTFTTSVTPTTTNVKATASGTALSTSASDAFVKSYPGETSKLVTTSVPNVTSAGSASN